MFSAEQYRAKATEFRALLAITPRSPSETSELRNLEQTYTTLAENQEWMAANIDKTVQRRKNRDNHTAPAEEESAKFEAPGDDGDHASEYCPHRAPTETPFDCASTIGDNHANIHDHRVYSFAFFRFSQRPGNRLLRDEPLCSQQCPRTFDRALEQMHWQSLATYQDVVSKNKGRTTNLYLALETYFCR